MRGSTDGQKAILSSFGNRRPQLELVSQVPFVEFLFGQVDLFAGRELGGFVDHRRAIGHGFGQRGGRPLLAAISRKAPTR